MSAVNVNEIKIWFRRRLLAWYQQHGRHDLPWKQPVCPYRIWVSEIMLQQTQVAAVIDYFARFMARFPSVQSLAQASEDEVLALWAGLGYYARARNLHKCAKIIVRDYQGKFPNAPEALQALPGIGPSTAGAITAQAFDQYAVILDGNVKRVLTRFFCVTGAIDRPKTISTLWEYARALTPAKHTADYTQAMMDIGATVCTKSKPKCTECPLQSRCQANATQQQALFPQRKKSKPRPKRQSIFLALNCEDHFLLEKRPAEGIWGGLYSLPEFDTVEAVLAWCKQHRLSTQLGNAKKVGPYLHVFTHFELEYEALFIRGRTQFASSGNQSYHWIPLRRLADTGLPAPIRKLLMQNNPVASLTTQ